MKYLSLNNESLNRCVFYGPYFTNVIILFFFSCEPQQVRHMMQVIEPQFQRDFISLLPKELALYTLSFLEPRDLLRAAQTCRYWRILAEDNLLWREKCKEAGLGDSREFFRNRVATKIL